MKRTSPKTGVSRRPALAFVANPTLRRAEAVERAVRAAARALGIALVPPVPEARPDALLVAGGDGSVLRAVHSYGALGLPLLCLNAGSLGYLSSARPDQTTELLSAWRDGKCVEESRALLEARIVRARAAAGKRAAAAATASRQAASPGRRILALNDLVALRGRTGRVAALDLIIDGVQVATFRGDGLVLATPTGSTAYSLSAGGPILSPSTDAFVATPVCPHALSSRPLVLPGRSVATVRAARAEAPVQISADGELRATLRTGDALEATISDVRIRLLRLPGADPFEPLRAKLGWGATPCG